MSINITGVDLQKFVKRVYALSRPAGLGYLHYKPGDLSDDEAAALIIPDGPIAVSMDYVNGRQCKMTVRRNTAGQLTINDLWFDHTALDLTTLLADCPSPC